jgi:hypothetical protein
MIYCSGISMCGLMYKNQSTKYIMPKKCFFDMNRASNNI